MRAAKTILKENCMTVTFQANGISVAEAVHAINAAREEAIKECAERAVVSLPYHLHLHGTKNVDRDSILSLIKKLK